MMFVTYLQQTGVQLHESLALQSLVSPCITLPPSPPRSSSLRLFTLFLSPISAGRVSNRKTLARFKQAALRFLDKLAHNALQPPSKEGYIKIVTMLEDIPDDCTPWMANVLVGSSDT